MKNVLKKMFGQKGFSLPEVMLAVGLMGGMSLLVTHVVKQTDQAKKSSETNSNTFAALYEIQSLFNKKEFCALNLQGKTVSDPITVIKSKNTNPPYAEKVHYEVGKTYDGGSILLQSLTLSRSGSESFINVSIQKVGNKKENGLNPTTITKSIPINAEFDGSGRVMSCQSDVVNHVDAAVKNALEKICSGLNLSYDSAKKRCFTNPQMGVAPATACGAGQSLVSFQLPSGEYTIQCEDTMGLQGTCGDNQLLRRNGPKSFTCVDISCSSTGIFQGLSTLDGSPICLNFAEGTMPVFANGVIKSKRPACVNTSGGVLQAYMAGIDSDGDAVCNKLVDDSSLNCTAGKLAVRADGSVAYDCCVAVCGDSANYCTGTNYPSANGCGQCTGTQPVSCPDSSNYCAGTSYAGTCGLCSGTRLPTNGEWGPWVATNEYQDKAGAACDCATSKMPQQRKYARTCSVPACGGATCVGDAEEWRDEGAGASCTPTSCGLHYFFTAQSYTANLGGQAGADAKCNSDANRDTTKVYQANLGDHCNEWVTNTGGYGVSGCRYPYTGPWTNSTIGTEGLTKTGNSYSPVYGNFSGTYWSAYKYYGLTGPTTNCNNWTSSGACPAGTQGGSCAVRMQGVGTIGSTYNMSGFVQACSESHKILCIQKLSNATCTKVDGGWSAWTAWDTSSCSGSGTQYKYRNRWCNNPYPACGGSICAGADNYMAAYERAVCP